MPNDSSTRPQGGGSTPHYGLTGLEYYETREAAFAAIRGDITDLLGRLSWVRGQVMADLKLHRDLDPVEDSVLRRKVGWLDKRIDALQGFKKRQLISYEDVKKNLNKERQNQRRESWSLWRRALHSMYRATLPFRSPRTISPKDAVAKLKDERRVDAAVRELRSLIRGDDYLRGEWERGELKRVNQFVSPRRRGGAQPPGVRPDQPAPRPAPIPQSRLVPSAYSLGVEGRPYQPYPPRVSGAAGPRRRNPQAPPFQPRRPILPGPAPGQPAPGWGPGPYPDMPVRTAALTPSVVPHPQAHRQTHRQAPPPSGSYPLARPMKRKPVPGRTP